MKNEEAIRYTTDTEETVNPTAIFDARIMLKGNQQEGIAITSAKKLEQFCAELIANSAVEEMHLICVNAQCQVISEALISRGGISSVDAPIANIAKIALLSNAHSVFLTHNHPGGTSNPSGADITATLQIKKALQMFEIMVLDHMIMTPSGKGYSMMQHGDISL